MPVAGQKRRATGATGATGATRRNGRHAEVSIVRSYFCLLSPFNDLRRHSLTSPSFSSTSLPRRRHLANHPLARRRHLQIESHSSPANTEKPIPIWCYRHVLRPRFSHQDAQCRPRCCALLPARANPGRGNCERHLWTTFELYRRRHLSGIPASFPHRAPAFIDCSLFPVDSTPLDGCLCTYSCIVESVCVAPSLCSFQVHSVSVSLHSLFSARSFLPSFLCTFPACERPHRSCFPVT